MRLGRSIAALGGALALVAAGAALASPVAADESGLHLDKGDVIRTAPDNDKGVTVTGSGCAPVNGKPSTVAWDVHVPLMSDSLMQGAILANEDGTWSVDLDIVGLVRDNHLSDPSAGVVNFTCVNYNGETTSGEQARLEIDSTDVDGKAAIVSSDDDGDGNYDHQRFDIDLTGFTPGEEVLFYLAHADSEDYVRSLFTVTADGTGRVTYTGDVPKENLADGKYLIVAWGSQYGEGLVSKPIDVVNGWWNIQDGDIPIDPNPNPNPNPNPDNPNPDPGVNPNPAPATTAPTTAAAKPANGKSGLANTGAGLGIAVVAGGLLASGGILAARRRRAA